MADAADCIAFMERLRVSFAGGYYAEPDWGNRVREWSKHLRRFKASTLDDASGEIATHFANLKFPNLGQAELVCTNIERRRPTEQGTLFEPPAEDLSSFHVPSGLSEDNPYRIQAEEWEAKIRAGEPIDVGDAARTMQDLISEVGEEIT